MINRYSKWFLLFLRINTAEGCCNVAFMPFAIYLVVATFKKK